MKVEGNTKILFQMKIRFLPAANRHVWFELKVEKKEKEKGLMDFGKLELHNLFLQF